MGRAVVGYSRCVAGTMLEMSMVLHTSILSSDLLHFYLFFHAKSQQIFAFFVEKKHDMIDAYNECNTHMNNV